MQTVSEYVLLHLPQYAPKELRHQKQVRNQFQRRAYIEVLNQVVQNDAMSALFAWIKVKLHIEYSMEHKTFWIFPPDPQSGSPGIMFPDDWSFPPDPWKHEWWSAK